MLDLLRHLTKACRSQEKNTRPNGSPPTSLFRKVAWFFFLWLQDLRRLIYNAQSLLDSNKCSLCSVAKLCDLWTFDRVTWPWQASAIYLYTRSQSLFLPLLSMLEAFTLLAQYYYQLFPRMAAQLAWSRIVNTHSRPGKTPHVISI